MYRGAESQCGSLSPPLETSDHPRGSKNEVCAPYLGRSLGHDQFLLLSTDLAHWNWEKIHPGLHQLLLKARGMP